MYQAFEEKLPLDVYLKEVEVVTQLDSSGKHRHVWPQFDFEFLNSFLEQFPQAKLVLNKRKLEDTIASIRWWKDLRDRLNLGADPYR